MKPVDVDTVLADIKRASLTMCIRDVTSHAWVSRGGYVSVQTGLPAPGPQSDFLVVPIGGRSPLTKEWLEAWCADVDLKSFLEGR